ncbi:MAG: glutamine--fructose-6-phosphate transaminase (isomerizing) [Lachnospiraceae bacterium]|nr:glutamine--fructose-6-phosphate transaminase (isomerizing) [Lachnospiraceae bacterium]
MCGIVGYVGKHQAAPILLEGLAKLEYRGYDSAGIAVRNGNGETEIVKAKGRLSQLADKTDKGRAVPGTCGIGHTRWATHGEPSENNAHPHCSDDMNVVGVHNGIIENFKELKAKLLRHDYKFYSDTDTEVAIKLIDYYYKKYQGTPVDAINHALVRIRGTYALAVMFKEYPGEVYVARKDSPMILGISDEGTFVGSDVPAILKYTRKVYYIGNLQLGRLTGDSLTFYNLDGDEIELEAKEISWDAESTDKCGYEHYMMKEIHEQPKAVSETLNLYLNDGKIDFSGLAANGREDAETSEEKLDGILKKLERIYIVACGSAYHAGIVGKNVIEQLTDIPVEVDLASEFRYCEPKIAKNSMVIFISQSGETADTLAALRMVNEEDIPTLAIVNVYASNIAREADYVMYTQAGPEIAVATTKAYSAQLITLYLFAIKCAELRGLMADERRTELIEAIKAIPAGIEKILDDKERLQWFASKYSNAQDAFFIGRGLDHAIGLEGSLKMKEISYVHSEAYAAGELKHGTISLIEQGTLVIGIMTQQGLYEKTLSNMEEVRSRGAYLFGLTSYGNYAVEDTVDFAVYVPKTEECFSASLAIIPLQLIGYYLAVAKGLDVDKPRNLAKSVTVE